MSRNANAAVPAVPAGRSLPGIYSGDFPPEYERYNTQYAGEKEVIGHMWWDTVTIVSGTTTRLTLFNAVRATVDLSNMEVAGQLAAPKAFLLRAPRFFVKQRPEATVAAATGATQTGSLDDVAQILNDGVATLTIGNKQYGQWALWTLLAGGGAHGIWSTGDIDVVVQYAQSGPPDNRVPYVLSKPIFLAPQINFNVVLEWPAAMTLALGDTRVTFGLDGDLIRPVQ